MYRLGILFTQLQRDAIVDARSSHIESWCSGDCQLHRQRDAEMPVSKLS